MILASEYRTLIILLVWLVPWLSHGQDDLRLRADQFLRQQNYQEALSAYQKLVPSLTIEAKIAYCHYQMGRWTEAKKRYHELLAADSSHVEAHLYLSKIYEQEYNLPKAIKHLNQLVKTDPTQAAYYKLLGDAFHKADLKELAYEQFARALAINQSDITVYINLVRIGLDQGDFDLADSLVQRGMLLDSTNIQMLLLKSRVKYGLKSYAAAVEPLVISKSRIDLPVFYQKMLGYAYLQLDSLDLAIHTLQNLLYREQSEFIYAYLAKAHSLKGSWDRAIDFYKKAIDAGLSDQLAQYFLGLAKSYRQTGDLREVINSYEEAHRYSHDPSYLFLKGQASENYYKDKNMALQQYQRFLRFGQIDPDEKAYAQQRIRLLKEYLHQSNASK